MRERGGGMGGKKRKGGESEGKRRRSKGNEKGGIGGKGENEW